MRILDLQSTTLTVCITSCDIQYCIRPTESVFRISPTKTMTICLNKLADFPHKRDTEIFLCVIVKDNVSHLCVKYYAIETWENGHISHYSNLSFSWRWTFKFNDSGLLNDGKEPSTAGTGSWMCFRTRMDTAVKRVEPQFFCYPEHIMICYPGCCFLWRTNIISIC